MISLKSIEEAKHIVIVTSSASFCDASALYTHILRLHKKVSIVCEKESVDKRFSFLPWYEKLRNAVGSSSDLVLDLDRESEPLYKLFEKENISINTKMATALYAGLLQRYDGFLSSETDGTTFAFASKLIASGADYKLCKQFMMQRSSLSMLRLKATMLKKMILINDSRAALFLLASDDLISSGSNLDEAFEIMSEALSLPYVEMAILLNSENEVLKLKIKEI